MKLQHLVIACLLCISISWGSGYFNYILCLHSGQDIGHVHLEKRELADVSSGDLHIDLLQENITPAKTPKAKVITPVPFYVRAGGNPAKPPLPEVSSVRIPEPTDLLRTVRIVR
ncbi:MAG: hypothetical protein Q9N26_02540 [Aquificota bacterium]|nr:hypothetical protein [Aquificota bacterium]